MPLIAPLFPWQGLESRALSVPCAWALVDKLGCWEEPERWDMYRVSYRGGRPGIPPPPQPQNNGNIIYKCMCSGVTSK